MFVCLIGSLQKKEGGNIKLGKYLNAISKSNVNTWQLLSFGDFSVYLSKV